ncbi:MAG TPA: acylphosphatase, partial [bacterium]
MKIRRKRILVQGVVQGVGFRPFVYRLAMRHNLKGFVTNSTRGVEIEAEGGAGTLASFLRELKSKAPVQSRIQRVDAQDVSPRYDAEFVIRPSVSEESPLTPIPP